MYDVGLPRIFIKRFFFNFRGFFSSVSEKDLKRLHRRFRNLDIDNSGNLTLNEFLAVPGLVRTNSICESQT
jgi:Ca2+-binding EF-hand superfamily protein